MSGNVNGNNELTSQIINKYKEMYKTAGGNVDSLNDSQIASIFQQDLMDGQIDGLGKDDNNNQITLVENFKEKVSKDDIDSLSNDVAKLASQIEAQRNGGLVSGSGSVSGGAVSGQVSGSPFSSGNVSGGSHAAKFLNNMKGRTPSDVQETNQNDGDSNYYYSTFLNEAKQWAASNGLSTDVNPEYNYRQYLRNVDLDTITSSPEKKAKYQQLLEMFDKVSNDEMDVASCYQFAKENFGDLNTFKLAEASTTGKLAEGGSSESTRQYRVLLNSIIRAPEFEKEEKPVEIEVPSIKQKLSEQEQKLAEDIASGKLNGHGWGTDPNHPFKNMDSLSINRVMNAATRIKIDKEQGIERNGGTNGNGSVANGGSVATGGSVSAGGSSDVNGTNATNDKDTAFGIPGYKKMTKKERIASLRQREKDLKEQIKAAKERLKANPDDREAEFALEQLEDQKEAAHKEFRTMRPALFKTVMSVVSPLLGLTGVVGSYLGLADKITDTIKDVNSVYTNVNKLVK